jgi:hypothetical protein
MINRNYKKKSPSKELIRENILKKCLLRIKEKRNDYVNKFRISNNIEKKIIIDKLLSDTNTEYFFNENEEFNNFLDSNDHFDLMNKISEAILHEQNDEYFSSQDTQITDNFCADFENSNDPYFICPICR